MAGGVAADRGGSGRGAAAAAGTAGCARHRPARDRRLRGLPPDPCRLEGADRDAHRSRRGARPRRRARARRRRLRLEAVLAAGAVGEDQGDPPARREPQRGRGAHLARNRASARLARSHRRGRDGRADEEGVRPARLLPRASRHRPLARETARPRLGHDVSRRYAHRRRARRAAAAQARRPGRDPHGARRRVQARRRMRDEPPLAAVPGDRRRRAHLRRAHDRLGLVLTRRAVERARCSDLAHQADLIAANKGFRR